MKNKLFSILILGIISLSLLCSFSRNLDKNNSEHIHALLLELNRELSMTLIVVTHNMELAACMSRRVTIVDGKLSDMP